MKKVTTITNEECEHFTDCMNFGLRQECYTYTPKNCYMFKPINFDTILNEKRGKPYEPAGY